MTILGMLLRRPPRTGGVLQAGRRERSPRPAFLPILLIVLPPLLSACDARTASESIILGWQTPWATQGQLVMGMQHTNIPSVAGISLEYEGFAYGGPLNLAALAGEVDVVLTADQPALVLLSRSADWSVVARMMYNRVCVYVPVRSPIQALSDLEGATLLGPVGAAAERVALAALREAGVAVEDMALGQLDMTQQAALLARTAPEATTWSEADALYGFDPLPAIFESEGSARMIHCGPVVSVVVASREMLEERPDELRRFLQAFAMSWLFFAQNPSQANAWFAEAARLEVGDEVLDRAASVEPNRTAASIGDVRLDFTDDDLAVLDAALGFLLDRGIVAERFDPGERIDLGPLRTALDADLQELYSRVRVGR